MKNRNRKNRQYEELASETNEKENTGEFLNIFEKIQDKGIGSSLNLKDLELAKEFFTFLNKQKSHSGEVSSHTYSEAQPLEEQSMTSIHSKSNSNLERYNHTSYPKTSCEQHSCRQMPYSQASYSESSNHSCQNHSCQNRPCPNRSCPNHPLSQHSCRTETAGHTLLF